VIFYRSNGDELSLRFGYEGTLSTAYLTYGGMRRDVSSCLPGISESNVHDYLKPFGFSLNPPGSHLYPLLASLFLQGLTTTLVEEEGDLLRAAVALEKDRGSPHCPVVYVGLFEKETGKCVKILKRNSNSHLHQSY